MDSQRPRVFLDISEGTEPIGRLVIELFVDKAPKSCENFRALCTGSRPPLTYKASVFHRIIDEFMVQGGDITKGDGTGGNSIYGGEFEDENIGWRKIDEPGLVCMANHGKDTNSSQFFITLVPCEHLNAKHTVFGRLASGQETLDRMSKVRVDKEDKPLTVLLVSHCGELERRKKLPVRPLEEPSSHATSEERDRGRRKRRRSTSPSRSPSPSRGHGRRSAERHRHHHRKHHRRSSSESISPPDDEKPKARRRSDASTDHTLRGRPRKRSRSRTRSPIPEVSDGGTPPPKHHRKRSLPPSRRESRERSHSIDHRRQRSIPNVYERYRPRPERGGDRHYDRDFDRGRERGYGDRERDDRSYRNRERDENRGRDGGDSRYSSGKGEEGRLGDGGGYGNSDGVVYKGRGAMKYREKRRW